MAIPRLNSVSKSRVAAVEPGRLVAAETKGEWQPSLAELREVWRRLYAQLRGDSKSPGPRVLAVSGSITGDGSTTNAIGLAVTMASDLECSVLLADLDLAQPTLDGAFGLPSSPGLAEYLRGQCEFDAALRRTSLENLWLIPGGGEAKDHARLVRSSSMTELVSVMRTRFDFAILDLPPLAVTSDAEVLASLADGLVLVVRAGVTPSKVITKAIGLVGEERIAGVIINGARAVIPGWVQRLL